MAKKKKFDESNQAHGALEGKSIYELMGKKVFPYEEKTIEEYRKKLNAMDFVDLQRHAVQVANILPNVDKRNQLIDKLEREYLKKSYAFIGHPAQGQNPMDGPDDIMRILSKGR